MCLKGEKVENTCEGDSGKFHRITNLGDIGVKLVGRKVSN